MNGENTPAGFQVVVFTVAGHEFGIRISAVREIISFSQVVALPEMPPWMVGITNVRGTMLPIFDLRKRFEMGDSLVSDRTNQRVLLIELENSMVGYLVDSVAEVLHVSNHSLEALNNIHGMDQSLMNYICKVDDRLIQIVNPKKLMTSQEIQQLEKLRRREQYVS
jgi:purine-binding chemotaxis protein CheW